VQAALLESEAQLYAMGIYDANFSTRHLPEERDGPRLLEDLADPTGGREFAVWNPDDLPAIAAQIGNELRTQYLLGYSPRDKAHDGKYRSVAVKVMAPVDTPQLRIYHRRGYYSDVE
jgi:Ca-activated chloride channel family protein